MIPLPYRLRPTTLDEIVGQEHILSVGKPLREMIQQDDFNSLIFYGPPGTGKTTLAEIIAKQSSKPFYRLNATTLKVIDIRKICESSKHTTSTIFIDEIHRATSVQQATLLSDLEKGTIKFIGATTENPFHTIESPLISRSLLFCFEPLKKKDLLKIILKSKEYYNTQNIDINFETDAINYLTTIVCGDSRKILTIIETIINIHNTPSITITKKHIQQVCPSKYYTYNDDQHYDLASWLQGAIQASDPDAAIYALAKWLESGGDIKYIARRIMVSASEDCAGSPEAWIAANNAWIAANHIGRPEADIILALAVTTLATRPRNKSAANAIWNALADVRNNEDIVVPPTMRDCHYPGAEKLGHGDYHDGANQEAYIGVKKKYFISENP